MEKKSKKVTKRKLFVGLLVYFAIFFAVVLFIVEGFQPDKAPFAAPETLALTAAIVAALLFLRYVLATWIPDTSTLPGKILHFGAPVVDALFFLVGSVVKLTENVTRKKWSAKRGRKAK